jgi:hypothetical protein
MTRFILASLALAISILPLYAPKRQAFTPIDLVIRQELTAISP